MTSKTVLVLAALIGLAILVAFLSSTPLEKIDPAAAMESLDSEKPSASPMVAGAAVDASVRESQMNEIKARLAEKLAGNHVRRGEALLAFKDAAAYQRFLERASKEGIEMSGRSDALRSVRVATKDLSALANELLDHSSDLADISGNYLLAPPGTPPSAQERAARTSVPLGNHLLGFLGLTGDDQTLGRGVTIAVIDSGISADTTFGTGRVRYLDVGYGTGISRDADGGHGTAVAALAAGSSPDAHGVAPAANLLGIRVADDSGKSDIFTVSQAIVAAADRGAQIINVSLGGYNVSPTLLNAIEYASSRGAVIVAAAGNDQASQLMWPAADSRVVSVGAVDALEQQVIFSNSGPQLQITAPGYGVQTAWTDGARVLMDGTSASSPIVAGAIAAVMSASPGMNAADAWKILQRYTSEAGPAGADPDYGNGVINLGWALARNDSSRVDTAISSQYYDATTGMLNVVVQNRSGQAMTGLNLDVAVNGNVSRHPIAWLNPGGIQVVQIPVNATQLASEGTLRFSAELVNPLGTVDQVPANNRKSSALLAPAQSSVP